jgi:O-antigen/teichoic acid export membrane protein
MSRWAVWLTLGLLVLLPIPLAFAESIVTLVAGPGYGESAPILIVFAFYALLLPTDRFLGVVLDVIDRPDLNMAKVAVMVTANVVGDLIVILSGGGLVWVAVVSVAMTGIGIGFGLGLLRLVRAPRTHPVPA